MTYKLAGSHYFRTYAVTHEKWSVKLNNNSACMIEIQEHLLVGAFYDYTLVSKHSRGKSDLYASLNNR